MKCCLSFIAALAAIVSSSVLFTTTLAFQPVHLSNNHVSKHIHDSTASVVSYPSIRRKSNIASSASSVTQLNSIAPAAALSAVGSPLGSISVLVHEAGHFIAARSFGITVSEFSVGVGPRLVGVRRRLVGSEYVFERINDGNDTSEEELLDTQQNDDDAGIEFSLRAIPLGGYVRFPDNYNRTLAFEQEDSARIARNKARQLRIENSNAIEKALESMAAYSFVFNVLSLGLLKKWQSKREEDQLREAEEEASLVKQTASAVGKKSPWWNNVLSLSGMNKAESETTVDETTDGSLSKLELLKSTKAPDVDYDSDPDLLQNRPWGQRAVVLSGGVIFNILLAFVCYFGQLTVGKGLPEPIFNPGVVVSQTVANDSPAYGVLKKGDVILGVNDASSSTFSTKRGIWGSQEAIANVISAIRQTQDGEEVKLTIVHGTGSSDSDIVTVAPKRNMEGQASIGVMLGPNYVKTEMVRASNIVDAFTKAGSAVYDITAATAGSISKLLIGMLFGKGLPAGASMSGPIGVVKAGADVVSSSDLAAIVAFAASISVNLAVINSLPLPALDGGQLVFVLAEAAAGRKIDQQLQESINAGALTVLLFISIGTAIGDVRSIF
jgi:membrane-associated protease RseP (regulator of RpoE activity)